VISSQTCSGRWSINCLVTGAAGFIGSHFCEWLLADGHTYAAEFDVPLVVFRRAGTRR
jgi:uncharacterized protein YbjT (DUF2867 family)